MRLRLLTYNIHKCVGGLDRRYDPERVAQTIKAHDPDIVILQEVARHRPRHGHDDQLAVLGERLGMRHRAYFSNHDLRGGGEYGNAVLSRFPITRAFNVDLTVPLKKKRSALHAHLRIRDGRGRARTLHVFNLHLGLSGFERKLQLKRFLGVHPFAGLHARAPIVIGGDLNDVWGTLGRKILFPAGFRTHGPPIRTFPAFAPLRALDAVYARGDVEIDALHGSAHAPARRASDHLPLVADLRLA